MRVIFMRSIDMRSRKRPSYYILWFDMKDALQIFCKASFVPFLTKTFLL